MLFPVLHAFREGIQSAGSALQTVFESISIALNGQQFEQKDVSHAIDKLKCTLRFIDDKLVLMREKLVMCESEAKVACAHRDKATALHQLRLKAMYARECKKINALRFNIESNILHMESVGVMMETVSTIKETSSHFKTISKHVSISKLENSIEEMFEQGDACSSIEEVLSDLNTAIQIDDSELKDELNRLMDGVGGEDVDEATQRVFPVPPSFAPEIMGKRSIEEQKITGVLES
tara:strand:+ start:1241 stop:1945 length:705 start_codon:yes stop_codon:yes gene_type:complete